MVRYIIYIKKANKEEIHFGSDNYNLILDEYYNLLMKINKNKIPIEISLYDFYKNLYLKVDTNGRHNKHA